MQLAIEHERRTQRRNTTVYHYQQHAQKECQHSILGVRVGILYHVVDELAVLLGIDYALTYTLLVYLVLVQFLAYAVLYKCGYEYGYERSGNADNQDVLQFDAGSAKKVGAYILLL